MMALGDPTQSEAVISPQTLTPSPAVAELAPQMQLPSVVNQVTRVNVRAAQWRPDCHRQTGGSTAFFTTKPRSCEGEKSRIFPPNTDRPPSDLRSFAASWLRGEKAILRPVWRRRGSAGLSLAAYSTDGSNTPSHDDFQNRHHRRLIPGLKNRTNSHTASFETKSSWMRALPVSRGGGRAAER